MTFLNAYYSPNKASLTAALLHSKVALKLSPDSAECLAAEGFVRAIGGDFRRALSSFRRSLLLNPASSETHYLLGRSCFAELNVELAAPMLERAAYLRPDDYHSLLLAAKARQMVDDEDGARPNFIRGVERARQRKAAFPDDYRATSALARCLVQLGHLDEAHGLIGELKQHPDPIHYHLACTLARAGEDQAALDILEEIVANGWQHGAWLARDPDFVGLRHDRRFRKIERHLCEQAGAVSPTFA
jgi:adenylate cyclase